MGQGTASRDSAANTVAVAARPRLIVAEDHPALLDEVLRLLEPAFDVVRSVSHGLTLLETAAELRPDVIVTDIQMPGMDGIEASKRLLKAGACAVVVVLSMYSDAHLVNRAFQAGVSGYVLKTHAADELIPAVHAALEGRQYRSRGI